MPESKRFKNIASFLLEKTPESMYWLGFLMADGCFLKQHIKLTVAEKDKEHLEAFGKHFNRVPAYIPMREKKAVLDGREINSGPQWRITLGDTKTIEVLTSWFGSLTKKTYNPPDFSCLSEEELFCLSVGFIDGDGYIVDKGKKLPILGVRCHSSWLKNLDYMYKTESVIEKKGFAAIHIYGFDKIKAIKQRALDFKLPILARKWDKVDLDYVVKRTTMRDNELHILELKRQGHSMADISLILNISFNIVSHALRRNNIKSYGKKTKSTLRPYSTKKNNTSGIPNLRETQNDRWQVELTYNRKAIRLGRFDTKIEAVAALIAKRKELDLPVEHLLIYLEETKF